MLPPSAYSNLEPFLEHEKALRDHVSCLHLLAELQAEAQPLSQHSALPLPAFAFPLITHSPGADPEGTQAFMAWHSQAITPGDKLDSLPLRRARKGMERQKGKMLLLLLPPAPSGERLVDQLFKEYSSLQHKTLLAPPRVISGKFCLTLSTLHFVKYM